MPCNSYCPITFSTAPTCYVCSFHGKCKKETASGTANTGDGKEAGYGSSIIPADMIAE